MLTFRTPDEAIEKANNTPYGLSAGVWTEKGSRILWMAERLRAGVVWANTFNRFDPTSPFGGYKESGFGREGGRHGLEPYLAVRRQRWLSVRPATAADEDALAALDRATWSWLSSPAPQPGEDWTFFDEQRRGPTDVLVAVVDGEVAGYVRARRRDAARGERPRACMIRGIAVDAGAAAAVASDGR